MEDVPAANDHGDHPLPPDDRASVLATEPRLQESDSGPLSPRVRLLNLASSLNMIDLLSYRGGAYYAVVFGKLLNQIQGQYILTLLHSICRVLWDWYNRQGSVLGERSTSAGQNVYHLNVDSCADRIPGCLFQVSYIYTSSTPPVVARLTDSISLMLTVVCVAMARLLLSIHSLAEGLSTDPEWLLNHVEVERLALKARKGATDGELLVDIDMSTADAWPSSSPSQVTPLVELKTTRVGVYEVPERADSSHLKLDDDPPPI